ncbi:HlyD family type I secretion periplasmic adaptor subunit [Chelativorans salis]|uniref:Membrane fusion protein (MFP) family protein n=1 Tax=Chelativorans salis TaxID=2978478 RepID=A0ABT2LXZ8_9HYPH|nr:HlyD family type I secretion periplasmic adaptor subunit [Chelativorans sp. EGI FJ00035]MCT7378478.1 HlyD family type I secretion periplasmic adaptor subunit [Chelativorans sp. EGI FJ00035]
MNDNADWARSVKTSTRLVSAVGLAATLFYVFGFGAWASLAPLAGAAVAPGVVAAGGQNQRVQHLEGGIVDKILVEEGDHVKAGQPLFELDGTNVRTQYNRLRKHLIALSARAARLAAERDGADKLLFPEDLEKTAKSEGEHSVLTEQATEFNTRLARHRQDLAIMRQRINALNEQIEGMAAQQAAVERQLEVVQDEAERKRRLLDQGLTDRSEYTALLRSEADLLGQLGQTRASILTSRTQIAEAKEQIARLKTQRIETAVSELNDVRAEVADAEEQRSAAKAVLDRIVIRSPSDGVIVKMAYNSRGSVVRPGDTLLELLPTATNLVIEARVLPQDVDIVKVGQEARLRFNALNARTTPTVDATVIYLSADRLVDRSNEQAYYTARLRLTDALPPEITAEQIYPGMPVETYIKVSERTFFEYLAKPVVDSFSRAFREE